MNATNSSSVMNLQYIEPFNNATSYVPYPEEDDSYDIIIEDEEPEQIHFNPHSGNTTVHHHRNETEHHNIRGGPNEHENHNHHQDSSPLADKIQRRSSAPVDPGMQDLQDYLANMDADQAKELTNYYIGVAINAGAVWCLFILGLVQYFYVSALNKMGKSQKQLEEVFMGPEIVVAPTAAPAI